MSIFMLYPEERSVTEKEIRALLHDAVANDEVEYVGEKQIITMEEVQTAPIEFCVEVLDNTGLFTFTK